MPTYAYRCGSCDARQERFSTWADHKSEVPCACGAQAPQCYEDVPEAVILDQDRPFKLDASCVPIGWERGNTDCQKQEQRYSEIIGEKRRLARKNDKKAIKNGMRLIASVPREIHRMRSNQFGKSFYDPSQQTATELKKKFAADGLLIHHR